MSPPALNALLWFVAILALIPVALWLVKRSPIGIGAGGGRGPVRQVATLPLSAQHRLVTVEVGRGDDRLWLVLGVGTQGVTMLHTMAPQAELPEAELPAPAATFANLLQRMRQRGEGDHGR